MPGSGIQRASPGYTETATSTSLEGLAGTEEVEVTGAEQLGALLRGEFGLQVGEAECCRLFEPAGPAQAPGAGTLIGVVAQRPHSPCRSTGPTSVPSPAGSPTSGRSTGRR